ncbi:hypothetical protein [Thiolapillus sp.]|uniref:hypothetical protein n=1 Tax=Thiolapillus sp. TaxID=2017437 RepID=UPI003AF69B90
MKNETEKYYVIEVRWTGPDQTGAKYVDFDRYEITTALPRNTSGNIQLSGWLGPDGSVARYAHGEYGSLAAADYAVVRMLDGDCRRHDEVDGALEPGTVALYRPGEYTPMSDEALANYIFESVENEDVCVPGGTITQEQMETLVNDLRTLLHENGCDASEDRTAEMIIDVCEMEMAVG